jgi:hypothetical protein
MKRKVSLKIAVFGHSIPKEDLKAVKKIYEKVEGKPERYELNLYVSGEDEEPEPTPAGVSAAAESTSTESTEGSAQ